MFSVHQKRSQGGASGHSHPPSQYGFVLDRKGFLTRLIKKPFPAYLLLSAPPKLNSWLRLKSTCCFAGFFIVTLAVFWCEKHIKLT
jgi:hypothetical protein